MLIDPDYTRPTAVVRSWCFTNTIRFGDVRGVTTFASGNSWKAHFRLLNWSRRRRPNRPWLLSDNRCCERRIAYGPARVRQARRWREGCPLRPRARCPRLREDQEPGTGTVAASMDSMNLTTFARSAALASVSTPAVPALRCWTLSSTSVNDGDAPLCRNVCGNAKTESRDAGAKPSAPIDGAPLLRTSFKNAGLNVPTCRSSLINCPLTT